VIECYYHWCEHHPKDEPFCPEETCLASKEQLKEFMNLRVEEVSRQSYHTTVSTD
jgi:hypothetical protein